MNSINKPNTHNINRINKKKITHAPTEGVDSMERVMIHFMKEIFELERGDYFITDEARLLDFTDFGSGDVRPIFDKIYEAYGVDVSSVPKGNLLDVFRIIEPCLRK